MQRVQATYSFYTWPSASVLAWFLWENRKDLIGKKVIEVGAGTALPGIVAAKCGAEVIVSESSLLPKSLQHTRRSCQLNHLGTNQIKVVGFTWGLILDNLERFESLDLILGADCFYDPAIFEDILVSISYFFETNPHAKFICTYQERSSDWSIEHLLAKWKLNCRIHNTSSLGQSAGINILDIAGPHTIYILEITRGN